MSSIAPGRWYQQPLMWLVIAIPALTVPAGLMTWYVAATTGHADAVADPVRRVAQVQTADLSADAAAARLDLTATLLIGLDGRVAVEMNPPLGRGGILLLALRHPVEAARDQTIVLTGEDGRSFGGVASAVTGMHWDAVLADAHGHWRLVGRGVLGGGPIALVPAIDRS